MEERTKIVRNAFSNLGISPEEFSSLVGINTLQLGSFIEGSALPGLTLTKRIHDIGKSKPKYKDQRSEHSFRLIDLFAGIGGFRLPFQEAGGKCVFSSEIDQYAQATYAANFGEVPHGDICQVPAAEIPDHDILLGGFPCQAFSQAGLKKGFDDTRGTLFFEIQRILVEKQPAAFVLENVKRLRTHNEGKTLETILGILRGNSDVNVPANIAISDETRQALTTKLNYEVQTRVLNARDFGVPQNRERIIIVGINKNKVPRKHNNAIEGAFEFPKPTHKSTSLRKILESNIEKHIRAYTISSKMWRGHQERKKRNASNGKGFGFGLVSHDSPYANTISARYWKDGSEILIDQRDIGCERPRTLTEREAANLQGFPRQFRVDAVSKKELYKQMGNSVAVPMIRAVCNELTDTLRALGMIAPASNPDHPLFLRKAS